MIRDPWPFLVVWFTGAVLAIALPVVHWNSKKQEYYDSTGYQIEYENAQRAYEEAQHNQDENDNNNDDTYYVPSCSWWQYQCRKKAYALQQYYNSQQEQNGNNNEDEDSMQVPSWYLFLGGTTDEQRRDARDNGFTTDAPGGLKLVYAWTLTLFVLLIAYGAAVVVRRKDMRVVVFGLFLLLQFVILMLVLVAQGVIETDERDLEDSIYGWNGQWGVLLAYTAFGIIVYNFVAILALFLRMWLEHRQNKKLEQQAAKEESENAEMNNTVTNYKEYEEPKISIA